MKKKSMGMIASTAVVGFLASMPVAFAEGAADHHAAANAAHCQNNTCKGHAKGGQNACKGKGVIEAADKTACEAAGGKWIEPKAGAHK